MKKKKIKPRMEMTHADWITIYGLGSEKRGPELLKILRDRVGVMPNEKTYAGYGGGWFFEQFIDRGFRLSTNDEGSAKVELQGLYWTGAVPSPFDGFLEIAKKIKTIDGMKWKLTRVDIATDIFGLGLNNAFPHPKSKLYSWGFGFNYHEHQTKNRNEEMIFTGFTIQKQRWSLTVYDKRIEITDGNPHPIKQSYFETLANKDEPITRIELRVKSAESLIAVQGALTGVCSEADFCGAILRHWGDYHRVKTKQGNDEERFKKIFRKINPKVFERPKKQKLDRIYDDYAQDIRVKDLARNLVRYGLSVGKNVGELTQILIDQMEWLKDTGEIPRAENKPQGQKPEGDSQGSP